MRRRTWISIAAVAVLLVVAGAGAAYWVVNRPVDDVHRGDELPFTPTTEAPPSTPPSTDPAEEDLGPNWPVFGRTVSRTRDAADLTDVKPPYRVAWKADTGFLEYPPSYADGVVYLSTNGGQVSARDVKSGDILWRRKFPKMTCAPAIDGDRVFFGARDGFVYALNTENGRTVWKTKTEEMESSPAYADGRLFMSSLAGKVRALDEDTGRVVWTFQAGAEVKHGPAYSGGRLFFGDYGGAMYSVRASDGKLLWKTQTNGLSGGYRSGNFYSTPAVAYGRVYIGNTDGKVYSFVAATGEVAWTYTMPYWAYGQPAVSGGRVFATSYDGTIAALDARTGNPLWRHPLPYNSLGGPIVVGQLVYVADHGASGGSKGHVYAYNAGNGNKVWSFPDGKYSPGIAGGGRLIIAGFLAMYALKPV
jgi:outer membrane protein assembly factor BamB